MMDPRFPPQPKKILLPLYPLQNDIDLSIVSKYFLSKSDCRKNLTDALKEWCGDVDTEQTFIFLNSGSACLYAYLVWKAKSTGQVQKAAVPAYCCPDVAYAIVKAGAVPVFTDIDANYGLSKASVDFAKQKGATIIIWPNFYGDRQRNEEVLQYIKSQGIDIILDDAQTFPASGVKAGYKTLISFGVTKRLNGAGGGALYIPDETERSQLRDYVLQTIQAPHDEVKTILHTISGNIKKWLGQKRKLEAELPVYVEKSAQKALQEKMEVFLMNNLQYLTAAKRCRQLKEEEGHLSTLYKELSAFCEKAFGSDCTEPNKGMLSLPTIFAIRLPAGQRYDHSAYLAGLGIQTTWYYYPINKISCFSKYESELTPNTDLLSSQALMLPYGLGHVLKMEQLYKKLLQSNI